MRKLLAPVSVSLLAILLLLSASSETATAANQGNYAVYGCVYAVSSMKEWEKSLPNGREGQGKYDRDMILKTHFPFEASSDPATYRLNFQKALHRATDNGWKVVSIPQPGEAVMYHERVTVWDQGRKN